jgi:hypothetical protein
MVWGRELHPGKFPVLCLLGRDDIGQEVSPGEEPTTTEDVEDVKDRKVDTPRRGPRSSPLFAVGWPGPLETREGAEFEGTTR